jgi:hypothetical protein
MFSKKQVSCMHSRDLLAIVEFAYNSYIYQITGIIPFNTNLGYNHTVLLDTLSIT